MGTGPRPKRKQHGITPKMRRRIFSRAAPGTYIVDNQQVSGGRSLPLGLLLESLLALWLLLGLLTHLALWLLLDLLLWLHLLGLLLGLLGLSHLLLWLLLHSLLDPADLRTGCTDVLGSGNADCRERKVLGVGLLDLLGILLCELLDVGLLVTREEPAGGRITGVLAHTCLALLALALLCCLLWLLTEL